MPRIEYNSFRYFVSHTLIINKLKLKFAGTPWPPSCTLFHTSPRHRYVHLSGINSFRYFLNRSDHIFLFSNARNSSTSFGNYGDTFSTIRYVFDDDDPEFNPSEAACVPRSESILFRRSVRWWRVSGIVVVDTVRVCLSIRYTWTTKRGVVNEIDGGRRIGKVAE